MSCRQQENRRKRIGEIREGKWPEIKLPDADCWGGRLWGRRIPEN
jgi:hypothetical protein